jgi:type VI secretion system protein ImpA
VPTKAEADQDDAKRRAREQAIAEDKPTPEAFQQAFLETPKAWYKQLVADLDACSTAVETLERTADARFGADAPSLIKLRNVVHEVRRTAGQLLERKLESDPDPLQPEPEALAAEADAGAGEPMVVEVVSPRAGLAAPRNVDEASAQLAGVARLLRKRAPADPAPYLMLRGYRWGELRRGAGTIDPHLLEAPPTHLRTQLKELLLAERWADLLEAGEELMAMPFGRGWLDMQRYAITACEQIGGDHDALAGALRAALRALLLDLPQLPSLTLLDDTPTANPDTQRWLSAAIVGDDAASAPVPAGAAAGGGAHARALAFARQGETQRAVELLVREAAGEGSERGRFLRRTEAASIMVEAGLEHVALPILHEILAQIETHQLERWEDGPTVALPLDLAFRCIAATRPDDSDLDELYLRICRLDPLRAMHLRPTMADGGTGN